jgi:hypothetical protein
MPICFSDCWILAGSRQENTQQKYEPMVKEPCYFRGIKVPSCGKDAQPTRRNGKS